jgi:hypothetical protein
VKEGKSFIMAYISRGAYGSKGVSLNACEKRDLLICRGMDVGVCGATSLPISKEQACTVIRTDIQLE